MDTVNNHLEIPKISGGTPAHKTTQTDFHTVSSGSLGPHEVSHIDEVVIFTGHLSNREISVEKGRVVVKILPALPALNVAAQDENKRFCIRFHSIPMETRAGFGEEDLDWDTYAECQGLNRASMSVNTFPGDLFPQDPGVASQSIISGLAGSVDTLPGDLFSQNPGVASQSAISGLAGNGQPLSPVISEGSSSSCASTLEEVAAAGLATPDTLSYVDKTSSICRDSCQSFDSASSSFKPATASTFENGQMICELAEEIGDLSRCKEPISRVIFRKLVDYDPRKVPEWYKNKHDVNQSFKRTEMFMFQNFANWAGWLDANSKPMNLFPTSSKQLNTNFVVCVEDSSHAFERISNVAQMLASMKRHINEYFQGKYKKTISFVELYETLSFKPSDKKTIQDISQKGNSPLPANCLSGIVFFFHRLIWKLDKSIKTIQSTRDKAQITNKKTGSHKVAKKSIEDFNKLLNACVNYNLAVYLIERQFKLIDNQRSKKEMREKELRERGELCADTGSINSEDLHVLKQLRLIINAIEEEGRSIPKELRTTIDLFPRVLQGGSFEERVLGLLTNGSDYVSKPLNSIRSELNKILANHSNSPD
ncbi:hypothetical protein [Endozoicomonas sp. ONNA2]|uniref:hypothetical protein n=1 Tax=Endozoicomonas sp. ONNA2 TaxID=2828741 RepID=UPI0021490A01|nr:hypothetical protein [Endozoicomonas sp. ONNA2]